MYRTDEEEKDLLKSIWKEYGKPVLITVSLILVGFFGYKAYTRSVLETHTQASKLYQQIIDVTKNPQQFQAKVLTEEEKENLNQWVKKLQDNHSDTLYSALASMLQAKEFVKTNNFEQAKNSIQWVVSHNFDASIDALARIRLSKIMISEGKEQAQQALNILDGIKKGHFTALLESLKGDAYFQINDIKKARESFQNALTFAKKEAPDMVSVLQIKLNDLSQNSDKE